MRKEINISWSEIGWERWMTQAMILTFWRAFCCFVGLVQRRATLADKKSQPLVFVAFFLAANICWTLSVVGGPDRNQIFHLLQGFDDLRKLCTWAICDGSLTFYGFVMFHSETSIPWFDDSEENNDISVSLIVCYNVSEKLWLSSIKKDKFIYNTSQLSEVRLCEKM